MSLESLRLLTLTYKGFDGKPHKGDLIVEASVARDVVRVFSDLYNLGYPIRRMEPIDRYYPPDNDPSGSDFRSIEHDNTSGFNCRAVTGGTEWSEHAYGKAIDLDPIENPYVSGGGTSHGASETYLDRSNRRPGMIEPGDRVVEAFRSIGWSWLGDTPGSVKDLQHFSENGH